MKISVSKIISILILVIILYAIFNSIVVDHFIKRSGKCITAYIYGETSGGRTASSFKYRFYINNIAYYGLMNEYDDLKIGDSLCVVYWEAMPDKNRPLRYFKIGQIKCDCNK